MKNQTYRMTMLFDFYGELLTERQKEFFDLYYNEDLSLSEIAENNGISRQGVRDIIVRAEAAMQGVEDKTGIIRRFLQMQNHIAAIEDAAAQLKTLNYRQYEDPRIERLTDIVARAAQALKEYGVTTLWLLKVFPKNSTPRSGACGARDALPNPMSGKRCARSGSPFWTPTSVMASLKTSSLKSPNGLSARMCWRV